MSPIAELVEMRLTQPIDKFMHFFEREQLPVLLNAPGIISVRTGPKFHFQNNAQDSTAAVSITLWDSLEAHETFLQSDVAKGFFQRVSQWIAGPPDVMHYKVGGLQGLDKLPFVSVVKTAKGDLQVAERIKETGYAHRSGDCIEDKTRSICFMFCPNRMGLESLQSGQGSIAEHFSVHVRSIGFAISKAAL